MIEAVLKEHNAVGIENALTITELCILTGKTIREITKAVEDERKSGVLICSRMEGFERRIKSQSITLRVFRRYMKERA